MQLLSLDDASAHRSLSPSPLLSILCRMQVANLGDSRCVLGRVQSSKAGPAGMVAVPLTRDHKPDRPDEHQRILAAGGQVRGRSRALASHQA